MRFWLVAVMLLSTSVGDMRGQSSSNEKIRVGEQKGLEIADQLRGESLTSETDAAPQQFRWAVKNQSKMFIEQLNLATGGHRIAPLRRRSSAIPEASGVESGAGPIVATDRSVAI